MDVPQEVSALLSRVDAAERAVLLARYGDANRLSAALSGIVGAYVHVITDDVPGAASASAL